MVKKILLLCMLLGALATAAYSQNIAGDWQGTPNGGRGLRLILHITKSDSGGWDGRVFSIDQGDWGTGIAVTSISLQGAELKFSVDEVHATYEGKISSDGTAIIGVWSQGMQLPLNFERPTKDTAFRDSSPHTVQMITADQGVDLEVLDWGGSGRPLVLLAGLGNTAHIFDKFAPKLTDTYHVYGITRRGFGSSSAPASGYSADRLGEDVLGVLDALKLGRPVLAGHSLGGEELSSVATRHPERIGGLVYLDAAYAYAYYDRSSGDLFLDSLELKRKLEQLQRQEAGMKEVIKELLEETVPQFERDLRETQRDLQVTPTPPGGAPPLPPVIAAIYAGQQKYTDIRVPALAIYAVPHDMGPAFRGNDAAKAAFEASDAARTEAQAKAFEKAVPLSRVVRLPHANHYVFQSNEADVLREIRAFASALP
jgi:pimeloyl-ACP methyl ester carboxylesterase